MKKYFWFFAFAFFILIGCTKEEVKVEIILDNPIGATVKGSGTYKSGDLVTLEITLNDDYEFLGWYLDGNLISSSKISSIAINNNSTFTAKIAKKTAEIITTINPEYGEVFGSGKYELGSSVTIKAVLKEGYEFLGWYKNNVLVSDNKETTIICDNGIYEARAYLLKYSINAFPDKGCTVQGTGEYSLNSDVILVASLKTDYLFAGWYINDQLVSNDLEYSFKVSNSVDITCKTIYQSYTIEAEYDNQQATVTGLGTYGLSQTTTLKVTLTEGFKFLGWFINDELVSTDLTINANNENTKYIVKTEIITFNVSIVADEGCTTFGEGIYQYGEIPELKIDIEDNFEFLGWYIDDVYLNKESITTINSNNEDIMIKASLKRIKCTINYILDQNIYETKTIDVGATTSKLTLEGICLYYNDTAMITSFDFSKPINNDVDIYCNLLHNPIVNGDEVIYSYVNIGRYPNKNVVFTEEEIASMVLDEDTGYYIYNDNYYERLQPSPQRNTDNNYSCDEIYYFLVEPITWLVLEINENNVKLMSLKGLECKAFSNSSKFTWDVCSSRSWLNNEFISKAFTEEEKELIQLTFVDNTGVARDEFISMEGKDTYDYVYLLSHKDAVNPLYGFNTDYLYSDQNKLMQTTDYARATGGATDELGNGSWWLRSPANLGTRFADAVRTYGVITGGNSVTYVINSFRPVMNVIFK